MLSAVIHSGSERWTAPGGTTAVVVTGAPEVAPRAPHRYLFLDSRPGPHDDLARDNVVAAAPTDWRRELPKEEEGMSTLAERVKEWERGPRTNSHAAWRM